MLAFVAARAHCWLMVNYWPTVGQLLGNQDAIGLLGHQDPLLAHGQLLVSCWPTRPPLAFRANRVCCCLVINLNSNIGQPLANQATVGLLCHQGVLLARGQPVVKY